MKAQESQLSWAEISSGQVDSVQVNLTKRKIWITAEDQLEKLHILT